MSEMPLEDIHKAADSIELIEALRKQVEELTQDNERLISRNLEWLDGWNAQQEQLAAMTQERDRWMEDSQRQSRTIQRLADAAEDRNKVDAARAVLHAEELAALEAENAELRKQLPAGMQGCTILFNECEYGHGWLTATNWVQHVCPTCEIYELRKDAERWRWITRDGRARELRIPADENKSSIDAAIDGKRST